MFFFHRPGFAFRVTFLLFWSFLEGLLGMFVLFFYRVLKQLQSELPFVLRLQWVLKTGFRLVSGLLLGTGCGRLLICPSGVFDVLNVPKDVGCFLMPSESPQCRVRSFRLVLDKGK